MHPNQTAERDLKILQAQHAKTEDEEQDIEVEVEGSSKEETAAKEHAAETMIRDIVEEDMQGVGVEENRAELIADCAPYQAQPQLLHFGHSRPRMRMQQRGQQRRMQQRGQQRPNLSPRMQQRGQQRRASDSAAPHSIRVASAANLSLHAVAAHLSLYATACGASGDRACFQPARARALSLSLGDGACLQSALAAAALAAAALGAAASALAPAPTPLSECLPRARRSLLSA